MGALGLDPGLLGPPDLDFAPGLDSGLLGLPGLNTGLPGAPKLDFHLQGNLGLRGSFLPTYLLTFPPVAS